MEQHKILMYSSLYFGNSIFLWGRGAAQRGLGPLARRSNAASGFLSSSLQSSRSVFFHSISGQFCQFIQKQLHKRQCIVNFGHRVFMSCHFFTHNVQASLFQCFTFGTELLKREFCNYKRESSNYIQARNKGTSIIIGDFYNYSLIHG